MYEAYGGPEVLELREVEEPQAGPGEVRVRIVVAGLNPVDWKIVAGASPSYARALPAGVGNDFAGIIDQVGEGVTGWAVGDEVFGGARHRALADFVTVDPATLRRKPEQLTWEQAGSLDIAGRTAVAAVEAVAVRADDTVLVSAAAGGVGVISSQLALATGATVIGTASEANHQFLRELGVIPVSYGEGLADRIRSLAPAGITAVLDHHGRETVDLAIELGVDPSRVNTIADKPYAAEHGMKTDGGGEAPGDALDRVVELAVAGRLVLPIDTVYPLERARDAYEQLRAGHLRGKIVIRVN